METFDLQHLGKILRIYILMDTVSYELTFGYFMVGYGYVNFRLLTI